MDYRAAKAVDQGPFVGAEAVLKPGAGFVDQQVAAAGQVGLTDRPVEAVGQPSFCPVQISADRVK